MSEVELMAALKATPRLFQWRFECPAGPGDVTSSAGFSEGGACHYSLYNTEMKRFLHWEKNVGVNIGFTDDASDKTKQARSRWIVTSQSGGIVKSGDKVAIGFGKSPTYLRYGTPNQKIGVQLKFVEAPAFEWIVLSGAIGAPVVLGADAAVFNTSVHREQGTGDFFVHFPRKIGANVGWTTSPSELDWILAHKSQILAIVKTAAAVFA